MPAQKGIEVLISAKYNLKHCYKIEYYLSDPIVMAAQVAQVFLGDQAPHVDGRVVAGAEQEPSGNGDAGRREAGVGRRGLVLAQLLVRSDVP